MDERRDEAGARCPACGATTPPGALACKACGTLLVAVAPPAPVPEADSEPASERADEPATAASAPPAPAAAPPGVADTPSGAADVMRCQWCGAPNTPGTERCERCGAAFPRPDLDAALRHASEERIRAANDAIDLMRRRRARRGLGRLFGR